MCTFLCKLMCLPLATTNSCFLARSSKKSLSPLRLVPHFVPEVSYFATTFSLPFFYKPRDKYFFNLLSRSQLVPLEPGSSKACTRPFSTCSAADDRTTSRRVCLAFVNPRGAFSTARYVWGKTVYRRAAAWSKCAQEQFATHSHETTDTLYPRQTTSSNYFYT